MRILITNYLDVVSSWCFWGETSWTKLKERYEGRVEFNWKIALMDAAGLPKSRAQEEWFYQRSGVMNRAPFMLRSDWYEPVLPEYLAPNLVAEAARSLGVTDDRVRVAITNATLREGAPRIRQIEIAAEIAAKAGGLDQAKLIEQAKAPATEKAIRASTAEFHALQVSQRPTFVIDCEIGDRAVFSGVVKFEPIAATIESMLEDGVAYATWAAHFGAPPAQ
ncbi:MAG: DsbA family protein [Verrucomicrobiota bacterium]|nr:DsbA family protein [Verrucomicrobiota bacterium]